MSRSLARAAGSAAYRRVSSDFGAANVERVLLYGAILVGGYVVLKALNIGKKVGDAITSTGGAVGRAAYDLFHPSAGERAFSTQYLVWFKDEGLTHSVDSLDVNQDGFFMYPMTVKNGKATPAAGAKRFRIVIDSRGVIDKTGRKLTKVAIRA